MFWSPVSSASALLQVSTLAKERKHRTQAVQALTDQMGAAYRNLWKLMRQVSGSSADSACNYRHGNFNMLACWLDKLGCQMSVIISLYRCI